MHLLNIVYLSVLLLIGTTLAAPAAAPASEKLNELKQYKRAESEKLNELKQYKRAESEKLNELKQYKREE
jgi:hypothetical protein